MKKINLLAGETSSGSSSTTISNLGLIQLKPLLDIEPTNEVQELYPGDDGVSGYSFIRINGVNNQDNKVIDPSVNEQTVTPDVGYLGMKQVTVNAVTSTIDNNIIPENIKKGVSILGVEGVHESPNNQEKTLAKSDLINHTNESVTGELVPDAEFTGMSKISYPKINLNNNFTVEFRTPSDDKFAGLNLNVPVAGFDGVSKFSYKTRRQDKTVTPSTTEQTVNCDSGYVGIRSVTVNPVTSDIDSNIKPENIAKGVSILGVDGIVEKPADPTDQWNYDLLIHTTGNSAPSFPGGVNEDGKQYLIFCNGNIDLKSCLYGFGYRTSYVPFSYHRYSADLFKKIGDFIYVDATTLGGLANSDGIYVTYDFNDHNIPEKFYFNCGNGDSISVGTSCKKCGADAFNFDNNDYVFTRSFFEYNVNYIPNNLIKTTIDNIINRAQVRTIKICNEGNVINNNYPYTDFDGTKYDSYHLSVKTSGPGVATDETDSKYVDISKFRYKKQFAAVDITPDIDVVGCYTDRNDNITIVNNSDNYKIVVHDDSTVWMYANNIMDSSGGYTILLHYKTDNPRIKEFSFFNLSNVTEFVAYKPMTLGYCSFYHDNDRCTFIGNARLVNVEALALFGFRIINFETNNLNYAACGTRADASFYNVRVISSSFDETDYTQTINNSGKLTVDLSPVFVLGSMSNSSWASLSNTYSCSHVNFVFGTDARKISNRNQILDIANFSDEGGQHEFDLDISEIPADKYSQSIVLNNVGQVINGNRCITETYTRMLNLFIPLNSEFRFEGTFSETQLRNDATHITNVVMFNPPENNTFHNGFSHSVGNEQVLKFYYDEQYDITNFKTTIETEFDNVQTEFHPMTIICDNLKDCRYESGKNYGFVHSSRKRHSLIVVP